MGAAAPINGAAGTFGLPGVVPNDGDRGILTELADGLGRRYEGTKIR